MWTLIAEAIINTVISNLAQRKGVADKLAVFSGPTAEQQALTAALQTAHNQFKQQYPGLAAAFFDQTFLQKETVTAELSKLLTPRRDPQIDKLVDLWRQQLGPAGTEIEIDAAVQSFVTLLRDAIEQQPDLQKFVSGRVQREIADHLDEMRAQSSDQTDLLRRILTQLAQMNTRPTGNGGGGKYTVINAKDSAIGDGATVVNNPSAAGRPSSPPPGDNPGDPAGPAAWRRAMSCNLNQSQVQNICFDLGVDYEGLNGNNKNDKIRELLLLMSRTSRLDTLYFALRNGYKQYSWPS